MGKGSEASKKTERAYGWIFVSATTKEDWRKPTAAYTRRHPRKQPSNTSNCYCKPDGAWALWGSARESCKKEDFWHPACWFQVIIAGGCRTI